MSVPEPKPPPEPDVPAVGQSEWDLLAEIRDTVRQILAALRLPKT